MIVCTLSRRRLRLAGHSEEEEGRICAVASVVTQALAGYQGDDPSAARPEPGVTLVRRRRTDSFRFAVHTLRKLAEQYPTAIRFEEAA